MKLKICGLSNSREINVCVDNGVDYCGFILNFPKSHRFISFDKANELTKIEKKNTKYVGVLVDPRDEELKKFASLNLDYFQIYGNFEKNFLLDIKKRYKKKLICALQVKNQEDIKRYKGIEDVADVILWDSSGYEKSLSWDFNWLKGVSIKGEKMVAGNITLDKLDFINELTDSIDVSGALETNKVKDINKIKKFISEIKRLNDAN